MPRSGLAPPQGPGRRRGFYIQSTPWRSHLVQCPARDRIIAVNSSSPRLGNPKVPRFPSLRIVLVPLKILLLGSGGSCLVMLEGVGKSRLQAFAGCLSGLGRALFPPSQMLLAFEVSFPPSREALGCWAQLRLGLVIEVSRLVLESSLRWHGESAAHGSAQAHLPSLPYACHHLPAEFRPPRCSGGWVASGSSLSFPSPGLSGS